MGNCVTRSSKVRPSLYTQNHKELLPWILYLHSLVLTCKSEVELCVRANEKPLAVLIRQKQSCIAKKLQELQSFVAENDQMSDREHLELSIVEDFRNKTKATVKELKARSVYSNNIKSLRKSLEEQILLRNDLMKIQINTMDSEIEIEHEFQIFKRRCSSSKFIRSHYRKSKLYKKCQ